MNTDSGLPQSWLDQVIKRAAHVHELGRSSRLRTPTLVLAIAAFAIGLVVSLRQLPDDIGLIAPGYLVLNAVVAIPIAILLTSVETKLGASLVGARFGWLQATHIGLVASAANMLPLPGGPLVRVAALKVAGASLLRGGISTTLIGAMWIGLALFFAGIWTVAPYPVIGGAMLLAGLTSTTAIAVALYKMCYSWRLVALLLATKSAGVGVGVFRMHLALASLGLLVSFTDIWVFAVSDVAGPAVSIVPAGLGVNEAVAALMAPLASVPPAAAFLAVSLNRVIALPVLVIVTTIVAALRRQSPDTDTQCTPE